MISLIQELQEKCRDKTIQVSELLMLGLYITTKLDRSIDHQWMNDELTGYKDSVPSYRILPCELKGFNQFINQYTNIDLSTNIDTNFSIYLIKDPIGQLENLCNTNPLMISLPKNKEASLMRGIIGIKPAEIKLQIESVHVKGIIDNVRYKLFAWSLSLENNMPITKTKNILSKEESQQNTYSNYYITNSITNSQGPIQLQTCANTSSQSLTPSTSDIEIIGKLLDLVNQYQENLNSFNLTSSQESEIKKP